MPKSKLSSKLEAELREYFKDALDSSKVKFPKNKQYSLEVEINGKKASVGYVDAGFDFGSKTVLCEIEAMAFPAANLARLLCFLYHTNEEKRIYLFHAFVPCKKKNRGGGWEITTKFLIELLEKTGRFERYPLNLEDDVPGPISNMKEKDIERYARKWLNQIKRKIEEKDKEREIGIPWAQK